MSWPRVGSCVTTFRKNQLIFFVLLGILAAVLLRRFRHERDLFPESRESQIGSRQRADRLAALMAREGKMRETVWAREILAQQCGRTIELFWDALNRSTNKLNFAGNYQL